MALPILGSSHCSLPDHRRPDRCHLFRQVALRQGNVSEHVDHATVDEHGLVGNSRVLTAEEVRGTIGCGRTVDGNYGIAQIIRPNIQAKKPERVCLADYGIGADLDSYVWKGVANPVEHPASEDSG